MLRIVWQRNSPMNSPMALLLRTAAQDRNTRRRSRLLLFLALVCAQMGALNESYMFLVAAGVGVRMVTRPSRRCATAMQRAAPAPDRAALARPIARRATLLSMLVESR